MLTGLRPFAFNAPSNRKGAKVKLHAESPTLTLKPIPNPRGTQTVPQPKPTLPRSPDGRFAPEFRPHPPQTKLEK
jgi:hypothetical protein